MYQHLVDSALQSTNGRTRRGRLGAANWPRCLARAPLCRQRRPHSSPFAEAARLDASLLLQEISYAASSSHGASRRTTAVFGVTTLGAVILVGASCAGSRSRRTPESSRTSRSAANERLASAGVRRPCRRGRDVRGGL